MTESERNQHARGGEPTGSRAGGVLGGASERVQEVLEAAERAAASILEEADEQARREVEAARQRADRLTLERVRLMSELTDGLLEQAASIKRQSDALVEALDGAIAQLGVRPEEEAQRIDPGQEALSVDERPQAERPREDAPPGDVPPAGPPEPAEELPAAEEPAGGPSAGEGSAAADQVAPLGDVPAAEPPQRDELSAPAARAQRQDPLDALRARIASSMRTRSPATPREGERRVRGAEATDRPARRGASEGARLLATQMAVAGSSREEIESRLRDEFGIEDAGAILDGVIGR